MLKLSRWPQASVFKPAHLVYRTPPLTASFHANSRIHATVLRDYQEDAIASVLNALGSGEHRLGLSLATGSGKTVILSHLIDRVHHARAKQTLVLAHRKELVEQAAAHCHDAYPSRSVEVDMGKLQASGQADITVASVQSITNRLSNYDPTQFKLVFVDEAHHITAPSYAAILRWFGLDSKGECNIALVGLSATFSRPDGISLGSAIDHIVYHKDYISMIDSKHLSSLLFTTVATDLDLSRVKSTQTDFLPSELSKAVNTPGGNDLTVRTWLSKAQDRGSTLVFCVDVNHVRLLTKAFRTHGVHAEYITGETKADIRSRRLHAFKDGSLPVLLNCGIFTEGTDIPNIDCILLARPTKSRNLLVQMIGRGLRKHSSKINCHIIDMVASLTNGIVTTPTLFGLAPDTVLEKTSSASMDTLRAVEPRRGGAIKDVIFTDYDDVNDLIKNTSQERRLRSASQHGWVEIHAEKAILNNVNGDYLTIINDTPFKVLITRKLHGSKSPYMVPREIAKSITFEGALQAADTFAAKHFVRSYIHRYAFWRRALPTEAQLRFLNKLRPQTDQLSPSDLSKGAAADQITKLRHGVKRKFDNAQRMKKRVLHEQDKAERLARIGTTGPIE